MIFELEKEVDRVKHSFLFDIIENTKIVEIKNAYLSPYDKAWNTYLPFETSDGENWFRVKDSRYDNKIFSFAVDEKSNQVAWFPPFEARKISKYINHGDDCILLGKSSNKKIVILGGQHPGEVMSFYYIEGLLKSIEENHKVLDYYSFMIFPFINKTGLAANNHRFTVDGIDLNRSWNKSVTELDNIKDTIINENIFLLIDVHGDEVSKFDYVKCHKKIVNSKVSSLFDAAGYLLLKDRNHFFSFLVNLVKMKRINSFRTMSARDYFMLNKIDSITLELSAHINTPETCLKKGFDFINRLI